MKFGKYLQENQIEQWKEYYIHYKAIKKFIAMADFQNGISNQDEKYFIDKVEENVGRIEEWFLRVRNGCFERFEVVQNDLPKKIKSRLPCISKFTSFQQYTTRSTQKKSKKNRNKSKKCKKSSAKRKRHKKPHGHDADDDDDTITIQASKSRKKSRSKSSKKSQEPLIITDSITTSSSTQSQSSTKGSIMKSMSDEDVNIKERAHLIDMSHNDLQQYGGAGGAVAAVIGDDGSESESEDEDDESLSDGEGDGDDNKYAEDGMGMDDESSFNDRYLKKNIDGDLILPSTTLFIENAVFSHLPPSAHQECLSILLTLGKLKLFAWQNSEGVRKIIKKYDKRFSKTLTSTLWPKIKLNEFVQEKRNESYIEQVAAVLCTRTIPFGHLDANDLREKGVNLKQMAECIQQLEMVTECDDLKEIIPMNVEPRSYMANERTFLKWMRMAAMTVLVGMIILSMGHEKVTGVVLIILSIGILLRSYHEYYKRNEVLVNRIQYEWIDNLGPILLIVSLMLPMITYLVYLKLFGWSNNMFHK